MGVSLPPKPVAPGPNATPEERINYQAQMSEYWFAVNNAQQTITQTENSKSNVQKASHDALMELIRNLR